MTDRATFLRGRMPCASSLWLLGRWSAVAGAIQTAVPALALAVVLAGPGVADLAAPPMPGTAADLGDGLLTSGSSIIVAAPAPDKSQFDYGDQPARAADPGQDDLFVPTSPARGVLLSGTDAPAVFTWKAGRLERFRVEFSARPDFSGSLYREHANFRSGSLYVPSPRAWERIQQLGACGQPVYWHVIAKIPGANGVVPSEQTSWFSIGATLAAVHVALAATPLSEGGEGNVAFTLSASSPGCPITESRVDFDGDGWWDSTTPHDSSNVTAVYSHRYATPGHHVARAEILEGQATIGAAVAEVNTEAAGTAIAALDHALGTVASRLAADRGTGPLPSAQGDEPQVLRATLRYEGLQSASDSIPALPLDTGREFEAFVCRLLLDQRSEGRNAGGGFSAAQAIPTKDMCAAVPALSEDSCRPWLQETLQPPLLSRSDPPDPPTVSSTMEIAQASPPSGQ